MREGEGEGEGEVDIGFQVTQTLILNTHQIKTLFNQVHLLCLPEWLNFNGYMYIVQSLELTRLYLKKKAWGEISSSDINMCKG